MTKRLPDFVLAFVLAAVPALAPGFAVAAPTEARGSAPGAFKAHYTADWKSFNVGTSDLELVPDSTPGTYRYTWTVTARGIFRIAYPNEVIQKSWFSLVGDHVRPDQYRAEDGSNTASIDFDWKGGHARGESQKKPVNLKLSDGVQDVMSIQVEIMQDLKNNAIPKTFRVLDKDEIKDFVYADEGPARIRTALGELDTVIVSSRRAGGNRVLRMWFAPSLGFVPVQAERSRDGNLEFAMKIKTLTSDAQPQAAQAPPAP
jgi:hypothetical protein